MGGSPSDRSITCCASRKRLRHLANLGLRINGGREQTDGQSPIADLLEQRDQLRGLLGSLTQPLMPRERRNLTRHADRQ